MSTLFDKLRDPDNFKIGELYNSTVTFSKFGSKSLRWGTRKGEAPPSSFHLLNRVQWYGDDQGPDGHEPTFNSYPGDVDQSVVSGFVSGLFSSDKGLSHRGSSLVDFSLRGGFQTNLNRREIDAKRINQFLYNSTQGTEFLSRQAALQLLNPQVNTRTFNGGASLLAQIMAAGSGINFKRHGAIPEPAGVSINSVIGDMMGDSLVGNFLSNAMGGDYISLIGEKNTREVKRHLGDPTKTGTGTGLKNLSTFNFDGTSELRSDRKKGAYNVPLEDSQAGIDKINALDIFDAVNGSIPNEYSHYDKDFIPFRFEVVNHLNPQESAFIVFRAFLETFSDSFSTKHNTITYSGRGEEFYTYDNFTRTIQMSFKIAAQSRHEMKPLYRKLNFLAAQSAPGYSETGRLTTPYMKITVGDYLYRTPGVMTSISITWNKNYTWEIKNDDDMDKDMLILPHALDVSVNFKPIHSFTPTNKRTSPFISINGRDGLGTNAPNWLKEVPLTTTSEDTEEMQADSPTINLNGSTNPMGSPDNTPGTFDTGGSYDQYMNSQ